MSGIYNIVAEQGSTYKLNFTISIDGVPWNFSTYSARMQVRADYNTSTKLIDATTANGKIDLNSAGHVSVTIPATEMSAVPAGRWVYDLEVKSAGGEVTRILEGKFMVTAEVTQ